MTGQGSSLRDATAWLDTVLAGPLVLAICSIAIAVFGVAMLAGRFEIRGGTRVIMGCFVILGASAIAAGLVGRSTTLATFEAPTSPPAPAELPPKKSRKNDDPYAGASLAQ